MTAKGKIIVDAIFLIEREPDCEIYNKDTDICWPLSKYLEGELPNRWALYYKEQECACTRLVINEWRTLRMEPKETVVDVTTDKSAHECLQDTLAWAKKHGDPTIEGQERITKILESFKEPNMIFMDSSPVNGLSSVEDKALEGKKFDNNKLRLDLIPPEVIQGLGVALTVGSIKYGDRNWEKGINYMRVLGAALRHLLDVLFKVDLDEETKVQHIHLCMTELAFACTFMARGMTEFDDRPIATKPYSDEEVLAIIEHARRMKNDS